MKETAVIYPSETIMFGEKKNDPAHPASQHYFTDLNEGVGNDLDQVEQGCHAVAVKAIIPADPTLPSWMAARAIMRYGTTVWPLNLWAVNDTNRLVFAWKP